MQQDIDVPPSIFQISDQLQSKVVEKRRKKREPAPKPAIGDLVFQFLRFRSTIRSGELTDPKAIRKAAVEMDGDLEDWTADLDTNWSYTTVKPSDHPSISYFDGKRHLYGSHWTAQMWNNWRTLRILVNKIILQYKPGPTGADLEAASLDLIHQLSNEICISSPDFLDSPRAATLIWPLSVVAKEDLNPLRERTWALEQLRHINSYMGLRQAGFLADNISQSLIVPEGETFPKA